MVSSRLLSSSLEGLHWQHCSGGKLFLFHLFLVFAGRQIMLMNKALKTYGLLYSHMEQTDGCAKNLLL